MYASPIIRPSLGLSAFLLQGLSLLARSAPRGEAAPPRDLPALVAFLEKQNKFNNRANNLLAQWGPRDRQLVSTLFLPPRLVDKNEDTFERLNWRVVAAQDTTRHSPAPLVDGGEVYGSISYKLRDSKLARQLTAADYDAVVRYLGRRMPIEAAAELLGMVDTMLVQAMAEHDEIANCDAIVTGGYNRRGNNGYFEYTNGPNLSGHRVEMTEDWSDPTVNPWLAIIARIQVLVNKGFVKAGIRIITTDQVLTILKNNPYTAIRAGKSTLVTNADGTVKAQTIEGLITDEEINNIFRSLGVQAPIVHDLRIPTRTGEVRAFPEGAMAFIGGTGQVERVIFNNAAANVPVRVVNDTIGFNGIGIANAEQNPGRRAVARVYANQADARVELEGWQTTGPVINMPEAISVATGIQ